MRITIINDSRQRIAKEGLLLAVDYTPEHGREIVIYDTYDKDHVTEEIIETVKRLV
jgi:hypothetical protein